MQNELPIASAAGIAVPAAPPPAASSSSSSSSSSSAPAPAPLPAASGSASSKSHHSLTAIPWSSAYAKPCTDTFRAKREENYLRSCLAVWRDLCSGLSTEEMGALFFYLSSSDGTLSRYLLLVPPVMNAVGAPVTCAMGVQGRLAGTLCPPQCTPTMRRSMSTRSVL